MHLQLLDRILLVLHRRAQPRPHGQALQRRVSDARSLVARGRPPRAPIPLCAPQLTPCCLSRWWGRRSLSRYRYMDWLLTVPLLLMEIVLVMNVRPPSAPSARRRWCFAALPTLPARPHHTPTLAHVLPPAWRRVAPQVPENEVVSKCVKLGVSSGLMIILGYPGELTRATASTWPPASCSAATSCRRTSTLASASSTRLPFGHAAARGRRNARASGAARAERAVAAGGPCDPVIFKKSELASQQPRKKNGVLAKMCLFLVVEIKRHEVSSPLLHTWDKQRTTDNRQQTTGN